MWDHTSYLAVPLQNRTRRTITNRHLLKLVLSDLSEHVSEAERRSQYARLCFRLGPKGQEHLTSRGTKGQERNGKIRGELRIENKRWRLVIKSSDIESLYHAMALYYRKFINKKSAAKAPRTTMHNYLTLQGKSHAKCPVTLQQMNMPVIRYYCPMLYL